MPAGCRGGVGAEGPRARCAPSMSASARAAACRSPVVATARKLAVLCWTMIERGEDYAFARPSLTGSEAAGA